MRSLKILKKNHIICGNQFGFRIPINASRLANVKIELHITFAKIDKKNESATVPPLLPFSFSIQNIT